MRTLKECYVGLLVLSEVNIKLFWQDAIPKSQQLAIKGLGPTKYGNQKGLMAEGGTLLCGGHLLL